MTLNTELSIAVLPGDGIGAEIMSPCLELLQELERKAGAFTLHLDTLDAGAVHYQRTGHALPEETLVRAEAADAILIGAMGLPTVRYPDGREIAPQLGLRERFELFAGVRPVRTSPACRCRSPTRARSPSTSCWCASPRRACSAPAARPSSTAMTPRATQW